MSRIPLMPKATAVWLVENTGLTFRQIADFCHLHELEVKGIADGDVAAGIKGMDPITGGQLTREEIEKGEKDSDYRLKILESKVNIQVQKATSGPRYTPVSRRGDRPDAIAWLLRYHPELPDSAIMKLVGTTKSTIASVRDRSALERLQHQAGRSRLARHLLAARPRLRGAEGGAQGRQARERGQFPCAPSFRPPRSRARRPMPRPRSMRTSRPSRPPSPRRARPSRGMTPTRCSPS